MGLVHAKRQRHVPPGLAAAVLFVAVLSPVVAADVDITANQNSGVNLNAFAGTTASVFPGVTVQNPAIGGRGISATTHAWHLTNQGAISGSSAIDFVLGGTVINQGQVNGNFAGIHMEATGRVENAAGATIEAGSSAVHFENGTTVGTVINSGTMRSTDTVVILEGGGSVTNNFGGLIEGPGCCNIVSVRGGTSREIINHGTINATTGAFSAGVFIENGIITNSATGIIRGRYNGIWAAGTAGTIINNAGEITSLTDGAIELDDGGTVTNTGKIEGAWGINFSGGAQTNIINSGIIVGTGGTAILLASAADTVTLLPGSTITGAINGGGGTDTFTLDGGIGTTATFNVNTNVVTNFEQATKTGAGSWNLAGNSGAFIPTFNVQAGLLNVNGTLSALGLTVQSGATLGGTGSASSFNALAGSTVAPGNSIGTLTVATATFASGSTLEVELNPTTSDLLEVTGTATIAAGTTVHVVPEAGVYTLGQEYLILRAGTRSGAFTGITDNSAFLEFALNHAKDPDEVWLTVTQATSFPTVAQTPNQLATAEALQNLGLASTLGMAVAPLSAANALVAFDQLSGEIHASTARALIEDSRIPREAALDRVGAAFAAIETMQDAWGRNVWARSIGSAGVIRTDGNAAAVGTGTAGLLTGADGMVGEDLFLGLMGGITMHSLSVPDRNSSASAAGAHVGIYGGHDLDPLLLKFGASLSGYGIHTVRTPNFVGFTDTAAADYVAATVQAFVELSHAFELENGRVEPFVRLAALGHAGGGYAETGGASALSGNIDANLSGVAALGVSGSTELALAGERVVEAKGSIGWEQHLGATPTATHAFAGGSPFTVAAAGYGSGFVAEASANVVISETSSLTVGLKGGLRSSGVSASVLATFSGSF